MVKSIQKDCKTNDDQSFVSLTNMIHLVYLYTSVSVFLFFVCLFECAYGFRKYYFFELKYSEENEKSWKYESSLSYLQRLVVNRKDESRMKVYNPISASPSIHERKKNEKCSYRISFSSPLFFFLLANFID